MQLLRLFGHKEEFRTIGETLGTPETIGVEPKGESDYENRKRDTTISNAP
jgi:hypothetical protein